MCPWPDPVSIGDLLNSTNDMIRYHCRPGVDVHFGWREEPNDKLTESAPINWLDRSPTEQMHEAVAERKESPQQASGKVLT